jgi:hypothetical protein
MSQTATEKAKEDKLIDEAARAMCVVDGFNPDEEGYYVASPRRRPRWTSYRKEARRSLAAYRVFEAASA